MIKIKTMANFFWKIIFRFSITKGKWPLPVQENPDHMGKNGCQKRILHPKKHRKQSFLSIVYFNFFSVDQCYGYRGQGSTSKMRFQMVLKIQIMYFQELFTDSKKLAVLSFGVVAKWTRSLPQNPVKSYSFLDFRLFQSTNWANFIDLALNNIWNPIFCQIVLFYEFSKRYSQIWLIF